MAKITGNLVATGIKFGIVTARFNDFINDKLLSGAVDALVRAFLLPPFSEQFSYSWAKCLE